MKIYIELSSESSILILNVVQLFCLWEVIMQYQKNLSCPKLSIPLKKTEDFGIYLNKSSSCAGVWFDEGELECYRHHQERMESTYGKQITFKPFFISIPKHTCPVCSSATLVPGMIGNLKVFCCNRCTEFFISKQPEGHYDYKDLACSVVSPEESDSSGLYDVLANGFSAQGESGLSELFDILADGFSTIIECGSNLFGDF